MKMTPEQFAEKILAGELHFPFSAVLLTDPLNVRNPTIRQGVEFKDRDGNLVVTFRTPDELSDFIKAMIHILRAAKLRRDAEMRAN